MAAFTFTSCACAGTAIAETTVPRRQALRRMEAFLVGFVMMVQAEVRE